MKFSCGSEETIREVNLNFFPVRSYYLRKRSNLPNGPLLEDE